MRERVIRYKGQNIIVKFHIDRCTHYSACLRGAPSVFDVTQEPWIKPDEESADKVAEICEKCPTGALHYQRRDGAQEEVVPTENVIVVAENGPLYIHGNIELRDPDGTLLVEDTRLALCRCGFSAIEPFCDGQHKFRGLWSKGTFEGDNTIIEKSDETPEKLMVTIVPNGPFMISGPMIIENGLGSIKYQGRQAALCRCGQSKNKPFCDGAHLSLNKDD